ncbi:MAG: HD domain-containing protein, partial [bacterium]
MPILFKDSFERILDKTSRYLPFDELELVRRAYEFTQNCYRGKNLFRLSGEPAIVHALEVADKLAEWRLDGATVSAGILHDTIEDPEIHVMQLRATFHDKIAFLVEGVSKLKD